MNALILVTDLYVCMSHVILQTFTRRTDRGLKETAAVSIIIRNDYLCYFEGLDLGVKLVEGVLLCVLHALLALSEANTNIKIYKSY